MYDITSRDSFNALTDWLTDARTLASPNIVIILVGNKKDLEDREVTFLEASKFAQENGVWFIFYLIVFVTLNFCCSVILSNSVYLSACLCLSVCLSVYLTDIPTRSDISGRQCSDGRTYRGHLHTVCQLYSL